MSGPQFVDAFRSARVGQNSFVARGFQRKLASEFYLGERPSGTRTNQARMDRGQDKNRYFKKSRKLWPLRNGYKDSSGGSLGQSCAILSLLFR
jgi:hypothetical protein